MVTANISRDRRLQRLGWLARTTRDHADVLVGSGVSIGANAFWEGVHASPGAPLNLLSAATCLATGGLVLADRLRFFTPTHVLDRVFFVEKGGEFYVSNSLPLLLSVANEHLEPSYVFYSWQFEMIDRHLRYIPLASSRRLGILYNTACDLMPGKPPILHSYVAPAPFSGFNEYKLMLKNEVSGMIAASNAPPNRFYKPILTLSRGYDSTAIAALTRDWSIHDAVSIASARGAERGSEDVSEAAKVLGLETVSIDRDAYKSYGIEAEKYFYLTALAEDIVYYPFHSLLSGRMLFIGNHGDTMWDIQARPVGMRRRENTGGSMQEMRLRSGWVNFPVAFIGWQHHREIIGISRSREMQAWSVGGSYDRPIARRIAEETGVPRNIFGVKKSAVTVSAGFRAEDDEVSAEFQSALDLHYRRQDGLRLRTAAFFVDLLSDLNQRGARKYKEVASPVGGDLRDTASAPAIERLVDSTLYKMKTSPLRAKYLRPLTRLTFAAQVANEIVEGEFKGVVERTPLRSSVPENGSTMRFRNGQPDAL